MTAPLTDHVIVVGAGFSGTLLAINLLRHQGPRVTLIERRSAAGRGTAYSTLDPAHLLNVRAANMSAFPDVPDHFARWLEGRGSADPQAFASRIDYGDYLASLLAEARREVPERLAVHHGEAIDIDVDDDATTVSLADGQVLTAGAVVLALGNLPPHDPPGIDPGLPPDLYVADP